jgi:hypothetical protein
VLADPGGPGLAGLGSESVKDIKAARRFAELQRRAPIRGAASEKTSNKYLRYYSAMEPEANEDSLLSPITAAADRSEPTTVLVSEGSGLPRVLQQA